MSDQGIEKPNPSKPEIAQESLESRKPTKTTIRTKNKKYFSLAAISIVALVGVLLSALFYFGFVDSYVKGQFVSAFDEMGVNFAADEFEIGLSPFEIRLRNVVFANKKTHEKLFIARDAKFGLRALDLFGLRFEKNINVDFTEIEGFEAWVNFDKDGNSNFQGIEIIPPKNFVKFEIASTRLSLEDGLVHFGDITREISGTASEVAVSFEPENPTTGTENYRFNFDLASKDSAFSYGTRTVEPVDISAQGVIDEAGMEISMAKITAPLGVSNIKGKISDWQSPSYDLILKSTFDLTRSSEILAFNTPISGFADFDGKITGRGENYKIDGEMISRDLTATDVRLKALKVNAVIDGENSIYSGHGTAIAEMLTFEDFVIEYPQLSGNIRGTGSDFRWLGELRAAAARSGFGTLAGLYIGDAIAEYRDGKFTADLRGFRAQKFSSSGANIAGLQVDRADIKTSNGETSAQIPNSRAEKVEASGATLKGVSVQNAKIKNRNSKTEFNAAAVGIDSVDTRDVHLRNVAAQDVTINNRGNKTDSSAGRVQAESGLIRDSDIRGIDATGVDVNTIGNETRVYVNNVKVAKITRDSAVLGSLNIAGVRLTVREGRIEGTSDDFNAGNIDLRGNGSLENVAVKKPVFVLEPSGRYRASMDMSLGGGSLGSVKLGVATGSVVADNEKIAINNLVADVMEGKIDGDLVVASNSSSYSEFKANFSNLDLAKLIALQGGNVAPLEGKTSGRADLVFPGTDFRKSSGSITADIEAQAGSADDGLIPITGKLSAIATDGLFDLESAKLKSAKSELTATGRFDLVGANSNLYLVLNSSDAGEVERVYRATGIAEGLAQQVDFYQAEFIGKVAVTGNLTGDLSDPNFAGSASIDSLLMHGKDLGTVATAIDISPTNIALNKGVLTEADGGVLSFNLDAPRFGVNNISLDAQLEKIEFGSLIAALAIDWLPERLRQLKAETTGNLNLKGLPNEMQGTANLVAEDGLVSGQSFDRLETKIDFRGMQIEVEKFAAQFGEGLLTASGSYETDTTAFDFVAKSKAVPISRIFAFLPEKAKFAEIDGDLDLEATAKGTSSETSSYIVDFEGVGRDVVINGSRLGDVDIVGKTQNKILDANLTARYRKQTQLITANIDFGNADMPLVAKTDFAETRLAPFIAILRKPDSSAIKLEGIATGTVLLNGNLTKLAADGTRAFTSEFLKGTASFSQFDLTVGDTPLNATEPIELAFDTNEVKISKALFAGGGSNLSVSGTKALADQSVNNLILDGTVNLKVLNGVSENLFFSGLSDVSIRITGANISSRLNGSASVENATASTFIGSERVTVERLKGSMIFTTNQVQIRSLEGFMGGGKIKATGGAAVENLRLDRFRLEIIGTNISARLPADFVTTGNLDIQINARRKDGVLESLISGVFYAKRSIYRKDLDLADLIGTRREISLQQGASSNSIIGVPKLDLRVLGRNALEIRNNIADLSASTDLRITGDIEFPQISGRISAESGTIRFRDDPYEIQRGVLTFPPNSAVIDPTINLQAETQIKGYQVFVNIVGKLSESESLVATLRSNPILPQADVVSLVTTGSVSNTATGIPTSAQGGINTAAEILTDEIINKPVTRATDRLFGLNKFALDPIISGERRNPTARLTVGRQINRNLLVSYSTNLSQDQNQVLGLEYRISNRLSFVAQYEQRSLTNVTRNRNNFSFEIRLKKRF